MAKRYSLIFSSLVLIMGLFPISSFAKPLSSICKEGIKICTSQKQGNQTAEEALQECIHCCTTDTKRIINEKCFNSCTNKCAIKHTGKPIKRTSKKSNQSLSTNCTKDF